MRSLFRRLMKLQSHRPSPVAEPSVDDGADTYFVKTGYRCRLEPEYLVNISPAADTVYQPDVYRLAYAIPGVARVIDIGCGRGQKLAAIAPRREVIGIDFGPNIAWCRKTYQFGTWIECDLENDRPVPLDDSQLENSVLICADVIEHLVDPGPLLKNLRSCLGLAKLAIISTPERDLVRGKDHCGPPPNPHHIREWSSAEFHRLLTHWGFEVAFLGLTAAAEGSRKLDTIIAVLSAEPALKYS